LNAGNFLRARWAFLTGTWGPAGARLFAAAVVATHAAAAWFNAGFISADEHYQIIEFAQYKLGRQSAAALAWEFPERMRPALQPWLAALSIQLHHGLGLTSPFTIAFSLRLLSAIAAIVVSFDVCVRLLRPVSSRLLRQAAVFFAFFLWIAPTAHGRFSSENWGGMWLAVGVCLAIDALAAWEGERRRSTLLAALAGAAWGLGFYFRFQVAIAIGGAGLWLLFVRRAPARLLVTIALGFAVACAANVVLDHWLYGAWTISPLNYVRVNLIEGKSAAYGKAPWWLPVVYLLVALVPPFSLALIALLVVGSWHARRSLVPWIAMPFIAAHMLVAHKEPRFFMPLLYFIGPWLAICAASLPAGVSARLARWRRPLVAMAGAFCAVNAIALCVTAVVPVNDRILLDEWLWAQQVRGVRTVYAATPRKIGVPANVTNTFYESGVAMPQFERGDIERSMSQRPAFVYYAGTTAPAEVARLGCVPVFRTYPTWLADSKLFRRLSAIEADSICRID
jgi:phosphatidylinositol glycan class B